jgi:hypothetical protein
LGSVKISRRNVRRMLRDFHGKITEVQKKLLSMPARMRDHNILQDIDI